MLSFQPKLVFSQYENCIDSGDNISDYTIIPWNAPSNISQLIQEGYLLPANNNSSQFLIIQNNLVVDIDYGFFDQSKLIFVPYQGTYFGIEINPGSELVISGSSIRGCLSMWSGILAHENSSLKVERSSISDAHWAVHIVGNCNLRVTNSTFRNNRNAFYLFGVDMDDAIVIHNKFYYGNLLNYSPNTNQYAIYLDEVQKFSINYENQFFDYRNGVETGPELAPLAGAIFSKNSIDLKIKNQIFHNCQNGIVVNNTYLSTELEIDNCTFNPNFLPVGTSDIFVRNGYKIKIENSKLVHAARVYDSEWFRFYNNFSTGIRRTAFLSNVKSSFIENNEMRSATGVYTFNCSNVYISNNEMFPYKYFHSNQPVNPPPHGIKLTGTKGTHGVITENIITNLYTMSGMAYGIDFLHFNGLNSLKVHDNTFLYPGDNYYAAINISNSRGVIIENNTINSSSTNVDSNFGITINSFSNKNSILNNTISGVDTPAEILSTSAGIYQNSSPSNIIRGNTIDNFLHGIFFTKNNDDTDLGCNSFFNYKINAVNLGVYDSPLFSHEVAITGPQKYKFNRFEDPYDPDKIVIRADPLLAPSSVFTIHTNAGVYWPNPVLPVDVRYFLPTNIYFYPCLIPHVKEKYDDLTEIMKKIIENRPIPELGPPMPPAIIWDYEWTTFDALNENPHIVLENSDAALYYSNTSSQPLGQLYQIDHWLWNELPEISEGREAAIQNTLNNLNNIQTTNVYEENMKAILYISLNQLLTEQLEWNSEQLMVLQSIADQCSAEGGRAVEIARAMLDQVILYRDYERDNCSDIAPREATTEKASILLYPNPNTGVFNLIIDQKFDSASFQIYNLKGKSVFEKNLTDGENDLEVSISHLAVGTYIFVMNIDNKLHWSEKIVLTK